MKKRNTLLFQRQTQFSCQIIRLGQEFKKIGLVRYKKKSTHEKRNQVKWNSIRKVNRYLTTSHLLSLSFSLQSHSVSPSLAKVRFYQQLDCSNLSNITTTHMQAVFPTESIKELVLNLLSPYRVWSTTNLASHHQHIITSKGHEMTERNNFSRDFEQRLLLRS